MSDASMLSVAFWNTWLLRPRLWRDGPPVPGGEDLFAPDVLRRAPLVGAAIRDRFDVTALAEVFEESERRSVTAAIPDAGVTVGPGPGALRFTGSGLMTIADRRRAALIESRTLRYRADGDLRDADRFATKGALLTRVRKLPDGPEIDLVSTHLLAGGEALPLPGAGWRGRHHRIRRKQLEELVMFVADHRRASNPLLLVGDFNIAAHDSDPNLGDTAKRQEEMMEILAPLGVVDVWAESGVGAGHTSSFASPEDLSPDPLDPDLVDDSRNDAGAGERIDYLFLGQAPEGGPVVTADRPRRWAFSGQEARGGPAGSLSDHLCISTVLRFGDQSA